MGLDFIAITSLTSDVYPKVFHTKDTHWENMDVDYQNYNTLLFSGHKTTSILLFINNCVIA